MNETIQSQLNHTSIRAWKDTPIKAEIIDTLKDVVNRTASSNGMQSFSVIQIKDKTIRQGLSEVCHQEYIKNAPELWIFIADLYRNAMIAQEKGFNLESQADMDRFFQGFTDGALAAQNLTTAIESLGLGAVYFGSILNNPSKTIELLNLPKYTFPIVGVGFGEKDQQPALKPRMGLNQKFFIDTYQCEKSYLKSLADYDREMKTYYDLRDMTKPLDTFTEQVIDKLKNPNPLRSEFLQLLREQGFTFKED